MKINIVMGFFLPVPAVAGGATEKIWFRLAQEFAVAGHEVRLVARTWPGMAVAETVDGIRMMRVPGFDHSRRLWRNLFLDGWWGWRVGRRLPQADVVVCNTVSLPIWLRVMKPGAGRVAVVLGRMPKGQVRVYGRVDLLLATSAAVAECARAENPRLAERIHTFANPIDWNLYAQATPKSAPLTIGYIGRLHPEKGLELLLEAAACLAADANLPPWQLKIRGPVAIAQGGGGPAYRDALLTAYGPRLGDRLQFLAPEYDPLRLAACYRALDVFCYPSIAERGETFGISVAEAMAAAAVPVVSDLAAFRDLVVSGHNGFVFDHRSPEAVGQLASRLACLLSEPSLRATLAAQAQADVRRYDYSDTARDLLAQFARLTGGMGGH
jgi:glycosyltransferase involved in cell wall biosynthesis